MKRQISINHEVGKCRGDKGSECIRKVGEESSMVAGVKVRAKPGSDNGNYVSRAKSLMFSDGSPERDWEFYSRKSKWP